MSAVPSSQSIRSPSPLESADSTKDPLHSADPIVLRAEIERLRNELERVELALEAARMETNATQDSKERFLSQVAHELRTPLSAIVLWSSLIEDDKVSEPKQVQHAIDAIRSSAEEQRVLIDNLLEMSRILAGKIDLEQKQVDLRMIVHSAAEGVRASASQKGLTLVEINPECAGAAIRGDAHRLERAVAGLLTNAVQATAAGGTVKVELQMGSSAEISVQDSGRGFAAEFLPQMLRGAPAPRRGQMPASYGLGLPIARKIAELHGGALIAESEGEGRGARFTIRLPLLG